MCAQHQTKTTPKTHATKAERTPASADRQFGWQEPPHANAGDKLEREPFARASALAVHVAVHSVAKVCCCAGDHNDRRIESNLRVAAPFCSIRPYRTWKIPAVATPTEGVLFTKLQIRLLSINIHAFNTPARGYRFANRTDSTLSTQTPFSSILVQSHK